MIREGEIDTEVNRPLWRIGWNWLYVFVGVPSLGIALGFLLGGAPGFAVGLLTLSGGPVFAISGLAYVHTEKDDVFQRGTAVVERESVAVVRPDGDSELYSLSTPGGRSLPFLPKPKAQVVTLVIGDRLLRVHNDAEIRLPSVTWSVGDGTNEFRYDRVTGVDYDSDERDDGGTFQVILSDGQGQSWGTRTDPEMALQSIQNRIQAYESQ